MTILLQISFITSSILSHPLPYIGERKREGCPKSKPIILGVLAHQAKTPPLSGLESVPQFLGRAQNTGNPPTRTHDNKRNMRREKLARRISSGGVLEAGVLDVDSGSVTP